jgi:hypothetical protein
MTPDQILMDHMQTLDDLEQIALRIKSERDEALNLLRESLLYSATGQHGHFKTRVREFLKRTKRGA